MQEHLARKEYKALTHKDDRELKRTCPPSSFQICVGAANLNHNRECGVLRVCFC